VEIVERNSHDRETPHATRNTPVERGA
jgi:hypothetical protein